MTLGIIIPVSSVLIGGKIGDPVAQPGLERRSYKTRVSQTSNTNSPRVNLREPEVPCSNHGRIISVFILIIKNILTKFINLFSKLKQ